MSSKSDFDFCSDVWSRIFDAELSLASFQISQSARSGAESTIIRKWQTNASDEACLIRTAMRLENHQINPNPLTDKNFPENCRKTLVKICSREGKRIGLNDSLSMAVPIACAYVEKELRQRYESGSER